MRVNDKYGLSAEQIEELWGHQKGKCAGCGRPLKRDLARLDYDPRTYRARGFVCYRCSVLSRAANNRRELEKIVKKLHDQPPANTLYTVLA
jgi:hypothetical protein